MHKTFFIAGYPKSGTSHLAKTIASVLNASIGGSCPEQDSIEPIATQRESNWIVRKGHYRLVCCPDLPLLLEPHVLNFCNLNGEPILFIIRDLRDIAVSAASYHNKPVDAIIWGMITGKLYGLPRWDIYIRQWFEYLPNIGYILYKDLLDDPVSILRWNLTLEYDKSRLETAVHEQSFDKQKPLDEYNLLRKGITGDWKNVLTDKQVQTIEEEFGELMEELNYEC